MPAQRVIYTSVIEGLFVHGLRGRVTPALKEHLRALGLDLDQPLPTSFPVEAWEHCLRAAARALSPGLPQDEAMRRLGALHVEGYGQSLIGRATLQLMRVLGPRRSLQTLTRTFRSTDNYSETRLTELGPGSYEVWTNVLQAIGPYMEGLFEEMLRQCGARDVRATRVRADAEGTSFLVRWAP